MNHNKNIHDLIRDPSFLNWVNQSDSKDVAKWEKWRRAHPDQMELMEDARMLVNGFDFKSSQVPDNQIDKSWNKFSSSLNQTPAAKTKIIPIYQKWLKIAAVFLILMIGVFGIKQYFAPPQFIVVQTLTEETKSLELPDGSILTLNTNSKITYPENWLEQDIRSLLLEGEAFFNVSQQPKGKIFQIEAKDLTVQVIGTEFNFNTKRDNSILSLVEGQVKLIKSADQQKVIGPGQTVSFNPALQTFEVQTNQTDYWQAWTFQKWSFGEGTPFTEVLERIKETFHLDYEVSDPAIFEKQASGDLSIESRAVLLESLSFLLGLEMVVEDGVLRISEEEE